MKDNAYLAWALCSALLVISLILAGLAFGHHGSITHAIRVGKIFHERPGVADLTAKSKPEIGQENGFDGQFYYFLAHDPLLLNDATINSLDAPHLRARRILYSVVSRLLTSGRKRIPKGMTLALFLSILGIAVAASVSLRERGISGLWVFCATITVCVAVSSEYYTCETLATFLIFLALVGYTRNKTALVWFAVAAAVLTKEPAAALSLALVFVAVKERRWRHAGLYAATLLPLAGWMLYLKVHLPPATEHFGMMKNFTFPFWGSLRLIPGEVHRIVSGENERVYLLRIATRLWFVVAAVVAVVFFVKKQTVVSCFALLGGINAILLSSGEHNPCYDYMAHFARQLFILPPAMFFLFLETRSRWIKWLLQIMSVLALSTWYLLLKGKFI